MFEEFEEFEEFEKVSGFPVYLIYWQYICTMISERELGNYKQSIQNLKNAMGRLNIEEKKLKIIEQLIILNDESVFEQIENILDESIHRPKAAKLTKQDLVERARQSNLNITNKEVITQDRAEKLSESW